MCCFLQISCEYEDYNFDDRPEDPMDSDFAPPSVIAGQNRPRKGYVCRDREDCGLQRNQIENLKEEYNIRGIQEDITILKQMIDEELELEGRCSAIFKNLIQQPTAPFTNQPKGNQQVEIGRVLERASTILHSVIKLTYELRGTRAIE